MFKTILATASAALLAVSFGASAHAGWSNGVSLNGLSANGSINGLSSNGLSANGAINGLSANGVFETGGVPQRAPSFVIDGIELPIQAR